MRVVLQFFCLTVIGVTISFHGALAEPSHSIVTFEDSRWSCGLAQAGQTSASILFSKKGTFRELRFRSAIGKVNRSLKKLGLRKSKLDSLLTARPNSIKLQKKQATLIQKRKSLRAEKSFIRKCHKQQISTPSGNPEESPTPTLAPSPGATASPNPSSIPSISPSPSPFIPEIPQNFFGLAGDSQVTLTWTPVQGATSYNLYWSTLPGVTKTNSSLLAGVSSPHVLPNLTNGIGYFFRLTAVSEAYVESEESIEIELHPSSLGPYDPPWGEIQPLRTIELSYNPMLSPVQNGSALKTAVANLIPGDMLQVGAGTYDLGSNNWNLNAMGTAEAPISVVVKEGETAVLERNTVSKNIIEMGHSPTRYFRMEGFEMRGGSAGIRMFDTQNVWLNKNEIHSTGDAGITTNTADTAFLYITRNSIHDTAGYGEGMYLGANNGAVIMSNSIIALNHVYNTQSTIQGDGIELKQGSFGNWIVENLVHDTKYPCILVYGTNGEAQNVIERNIAYNSQDNVMQVQGEALVINNLLMNGANAFYSHDHQGTSTNLQVIHNTIVNSSTAARLVNWANRTNMVFANNAVYSQTSDAINFHSGSAGVAISGNITFGGIKNVSTGYSAGSGISDFEDLSFGSSPEDPTPSLGSSLIGAADLNFASSTDLFGNPRTSPVEAGAVESSP